MNNRDIELFAKLFSDGIPSFNTAQVSREPIELKHTEIECDNGVKKFNGENLGSQLLTELTWYSKQVVSIRESDKVFSKAHKAEEKRQAQIVKKLNKVITK